MTAPYCDCCGALLPLAGPEFSALLDSDEFVCRKCRENETEVEVDLAPPISFAESARRIARALARTVTEKNIAYGDAAGKSSAFLRLLYPDGVPPDAYGDMLLIVRVFDKLCRVARNSRLEAAASDPMDEDPWADLGGYALLALIGREKRPKAEGRRPKEES